MKKLSGKEIKKVTTNVITLFAQTLETEYGVKLSDRDIEFFRWKLHRPLEATVQDDSDE